MADIYEIVKNMSRSDKIYYFKNVTPQKNDYDNFMTYRRVEKHRNKYKAKYNEYMAALKAKSRKAESDLYCLQNNKDVAINRVKKILKILMSYPSKLKKLMMIIIINYKNSKTKIDEINKKH